MDWAAWGPTIVSFLTAIFIAGGMWSTLREHSQTLKEHSSLHAAMQKHAGVQDVSIAKLVSWNEGFAAARAYYKHEANHERIT